MTRYTPRPLTRTVVARSIHPSRGCGHAYSIEYRMLAMSMREMNLENFGPPRVLQRMHILSAKRTHRRWAERRRTRGNYLQFRRTGNKFATVLRGIDLFFLGFIRTIWPKISAAEINAFIFSAMGGGEGNPDARFYHPSQISRAESRLFLTRTVGSTTAYAAMSPRNLQLRHNYWNLPYPYGIANILRKDIIDLDESGFFLETIDRKYGKSRVGRRVREIGPYGHSEKFNLLMAISADETGHRWVDIWRGTGTDVQRFINFIRRILDNLGDGTVQRRRVFTMDNLATHHSMLVSQLIHSRGHRILFRAPYYPVDGPIEYVFNTIQQALTRALYRVINTEELIREVCRIIASKADFVGYFTHCGFNNV